MASPDPNDWAAPAREAWAALQARKKTCAECGVAEPVEWLANTAYTELSFRNGKVKLADAQEVPLAWLAQRVRRYPLPRGLALRLEEADFLKEYPLPGGLGGRYRTKTGERAYRIEPPDETLTLATLGAQLQSYLASLDLAAHVTGLASVGKGASQWLRVEVPPETGGVQHACGAPVPEFTTFVQRWLGALSKAKLVYTGFSLDDVARGGGGPPGSQTPLKLMFVDPARCLYLAPNQELPPQELDGLLWSCNALAIVAGLLRQEAGHRYMAGVLELRQRGRRAAAPRPARTAATTMTRWRRC
eukprot:g50111.t1